MDVNITKALNDKLYDKRKTLRERQDNREAARAMSNAFKRGRG